MIREMANMRPIGVVFELKTCYYVLIAFPGEHRCHFWLLSKLKEAKKKWIGNKRKYLHVSQSM